VATAVFSIDRHCLPRQFRPPKAGRCRAITIWRGEKMLPITRAATKEEIPVIDLKNFKFATPAEKNAVVKTIADTCRQAGFFYVVNHGIAAADIDDIFSAAKQFFALPLEAKEEVSIKKSGRNFHGYLPAFHIGEDPKLKANLQEAFQVHAELPPDDPLLLAGVPLYGANSWPSAMPDLKRRMTNYQQKLAHLGEQMLHLFALALEMPEDSLDRHFEKSTSLLRLLHYPPQQPDESGEHIGTRAHTDTGTFTILSQDEVGGLEILLKSGEWVLAPPLKHSYVVNLGEVMRSWSDGVFAATPHRVINRYGHERYSVPFFMNPEYNATFEPLVHNPARADSNFETLISNKHHKCYGDWIMEVYSRIYHKPAETAA
jgi:isopenicillin N synthase-like dioxygenase